MLSYKFLQIEFKINSCKDSLFLQAVSLAALCRSSGIRRGKVLKAFSLVSAVAPLKILSSSRAFSAWVIDFFVFITMLTPLSTVQLSLGQLCRQLYIPLRPYHQIPIAYSQRGHGERWTFGVLQVRPRLW